MLREPNQVDNVHILIAEDSPTQAEQLRHSLERNGYRVSISHNGRHALQLARDERPTLIISDVIMPEMDGYQLCKSVKGDPSFGNVPVILLTTLSDPHDIIRGLECRADNFIIKPYDERVLLSRIQFVLLNYEIHEREQAGMGVEIFFNGQRHFITADRLQILNLLLSTYEAAIQKNTELRQVQEELRLLNDQLERKVGERTAELMKSLDAQRNLAVIVESSDEIMVRTSLDGTVMSWNRGAERRMGYAAQEIIGKPLTTLVSVEDVAEVERILRSITSVADRAAEMRWVRKDRTPVEISMNLSPIFDARGSTIGAAVVARDVTEQKNLEMQLRQAQKMEAIGQLAGGVAHDFNNLLQVILGYANSAMDATQDVDLRMDLEEVLKAGERAAELTRQLLVFGRRQVLQPKDVALNELIRNLMKMVRRLVVENIELDFIPGHDLGTIHADPGQIEQVLMNLCINARDAMPRGGTLTIETANVVINGSYRASHPWAREGRYVLLTVSDTGIGMDEATINRIFEPFFTTKKEGEGTGLGLATVYSIVKQHGGLIHVYSEVDKGTMFKVYLPIVNRPASSVGSRPEGPVRGGQETILVAEDAESVRALVVRILQGAGYKTLVASDGLQAVELFTQHKDDIAMVLVDVVMPKLHGSEAVARMRALRPELRALFSSGYSPSGANIGGEDFTQDLLQKPYDPKALLRRVREILDREEG
jgi:PAS domain S-box-containing protein